MNPLTNMKNIKKLSEQELFTSNKTSWHDQYRESAWIFVGGLPYDLTEGDIICMFSQYGEIVNVNLVRDKDTGKPKGFCFICYEDQRSTDLAVDNLNGIRILNRTIRVDHVSQYKVPKSAKDVDADAKRTAQSDIGAAKPVVPIKTDRLVVPKQVEDRGTIRETLRDQIVDGVRLPMRLPIYATSNNAKEDVKEEQTPKEIRH